MRTNKYRHGGARAAIRAAAALFVVALTLAGDATAADRCDAFPRILRKVVDVRELAPLRPLTCRIVSEAELRKNPYVVKGFAAVQRTILFDEQIYKMLGLLKETYPYRDCVSYSGPEVPEVLYDPDSSAILIRNGSHVGEQGIAEEVVRALLDQHFNVRDAEKRMLDTTDHTLAVLAAINGDALNSAGQVKGLAPGDEESDSASHHSFHSECAAPETLLYLDEFGQRFGVLYINSYRMTGGNPEVDRLFRHLPMSTKEILYKVDPEDAPARGFLTVLPTPPIPAGFRNQEFRFVHRDTLGEYLVRTLFRNFLGSAPALNAARGWKGDVVALYKNIKGELLLVWDTRWTSEEEAREFFQGFIALLHERFQVEPSRSLDRFIFTSSDALRFEAKRESTQVVISVFRPQAEEEE